MIKKIQYLVIIILFGLLAFAIYDYILYNKQINALITNGFEEVSGYLKEVEIADDLKYYITVFPSYLFPNQDTLVIQRDTLPDNLRGSEDKGDYTIADDEVIKININKDEDVIFLNNNNNYCYGNYKDNTFEIAADESFDCLNVEVQSPEFFSEIDNIIDYLISNDLVQLDAY